MCFNAGHDVHASEDQELSVLQRRHEEDKRRATAYLEKTSRSRNPLIHYLRQRALVNRYRVIGRQRVRIRQKLQMLRKVDSTRDIWESASDSASDVNEGDSGSDNNGSGSDSSDSSDGDHHH